MPPSTASNQMTRPHFLGRSGLRLWIIAVWGSNAFTDFPDADTSSPRITRRVACVDYLVHQRNDVLQNDRQLLASLGRLGLEACANPLGPPYGRARAVEQVLICGLHPVGPLRATPPRRPHDPFHLELFTASGIPQNRARQGENHLEHWHCFGQGPAKHLHAIAEQGAVGGSVVIGFLCREAPAKPGLERRLSLRPMGCKARRSGIVG
jgi:hypothetical protein